MVGHGGTHTGEYTKNLNRCVSVFVPCQSVGGHTHIHLQETQKAQDHLICELNMGLLAVC